MMTFLRRHLGLPALLALLLIGAWVCIGVVHEHNGSPTCQICNALQFAAAIPVAPISLDAPTEQAQAPAAAPVPIAAAAYRSTPQGRAPPLA